MPRSQLLMVFTDAVSAQFAQMMSESICCVKLHSFRRLHRRLPTAAESAHHRHAPEIRRSVEASNWWDRLPEAMDFFMLFSSFYYMTVNSRMYKDKLS